MERRVFLKSLGILSGLASVPRGLCSLDSASTSPLSRFKLGAISDGFSLDFEEALQIMKGYGLSWVEIRNVWGTYNTEAKPAQVEHILNLLAKYEFRVSVLDTALYKCALPGTKPVGGEKDVYPYEGQMDLLKRALERAHVFGTDKVRAFTFWRVVEPDKLSSRIAEELEKAAEVARRMHVRLVIEDEGACNAGTGRELADILKKVSAANVGANWDIGNGYWHGEASFPDGYQAIDKKRIWHVHVKGVHCDAGFKNCQETFADQGEIDLVGQLRALLQDGYEETMSLECEFEAPGLSRPRNHQALAGRPAEGDDKSAGVMGIMHLTAIPAVDAVFFGKARRGCPGRPRRCCRAWCS